MPHFINNKLKYILTTNYKVMYTTLCQQKNLSKINNRNITIKYLIRSNYLKDYNHFLFVRNPYKRIISFFQDKFYYFPSQAQDNFCWDNWESSHKIFFPYL